MKKLIALLTLLTAFTFQSCQQEEAVDLEPVVAETPINMEIQAGATETEGEDDPTNQTGNGGS